jgi:hypothetical protein
MIQRRIPSMAIQTLLPLIQLRVPSMTSVRLPWPPRLASRNQHKRTAFQSTGFISMNRGSETAPSHDSVAVPSMASVRLIASFGVWRSRP